MEEVKNLTDGLCAVEKLKAQYANGIKKGHKPVFRTSVLRQAFNEFGECIAEDEFHNETVLGGALTVLEKLWGVQATLKVAPINTLNGINDIVPLADSSAGNDDTVCLWGVGIGGSGDAFNSVKAVKFYERELGQPGFIDEMIPFRVVEQPFASDDTANYPKYFMKRQRQDKYYEYFLKKFEIDPVIKVLWKNGADGEDGSDVNLDGNFYSDAHSDEIEVFVEMHCKIDVKDVREYFERIKQTELARINSLGLFTGRKTKLEDGTIDYTNVKLFSKLNFNNEALVNAKTILYKYRVYVS